MNTLPNIKRKGKKAVLYVDDRPFCIRGSEVHNSSASDLNYMEEKVWPAFRTMHMNTLLVPVYWECLEPEEGVFDYTLVDGLIEQARQENMRLILLWFGLWKNGASTYVPAWVKEDRERFWYVQGEGGKTLTYFNSPMRIISPFCRMAVEADKKAFAQLMAHLKEIDRQHTVIMVQVENEIGVLGAPRDFSPAAEELFAQEIPAVLTENLQVSGTWSEAFGKNAEEHFMAWYYGLAVEQICCAGKEQLALPMYVNTWLEQEPWIPGTYPSGGPQAKNHKIWRLAAPGIDLLAPDIYVDDFCGTCADYGTDENPLFIPECRVGVARYLYAVGKYNVMCFSPFGMEDITGENNAMDAQTQAMLNVSADDLSEKCQASGQLAKAYAFVEDMELIVQKAHKTDTIYGFMYTGQREETVSMSHVDVNITYENAGEKGSVGGGLVIESGDYEFLVLAFNCAMDFKAKDAGLLDMLVKEEGCYKDGKWKRGRILNGDDRYRNVFGNEVSLLRFKLFPYQE